MRGVLTRQLEGHSLEGEVGDTPISSDGGMLAASEGGKMEREKERMCVGEKDVAKASIEIREQDRSGREIPRPAHQRMPPP